MRGDPSMNSYNHYAYGAVADWIYRYAAVSMRCPTDAGFHTIYLHPNFRCPPGKSRFPLPILVWGDTIRVVDGGYYSDLAGNCSPKYDGPHAAAGWPADRFTMDGEAWQTVRSSTW